MSSQPPDCRRKLLLELFQQGLAQVDGRHCVRRALTADSVPRPGRPVWIAAVGKAAGSMALGAVDALGSFAQRLLIITKDDHVTAELRALRHAEILESAHPVPDDRSLAAGETLLHWVEQLPEGIEPLFLISGGASSLVEVLEPGATFSDLAQATARGLAEGIPIGELNARRARLSRIKAGRLTARLGGRPARALFISDVPGDDPSVIGSGLLGPALLEPGAGAAPGAVGTDGVARLIVGSIDRAVEAVAAAGTRLGLDVRVPGQRFDGDASRLAVRFAHELHLNTSQLWVWGGESTVRLPEHPGRGGRNQHLALAAARLLSGHRDLLLLAAGTDGTDGPTDDAGALVDADTCSRLVLAGLDIDDCLRRADAGTALAAAGDLVHTGPTGTNVGDLVIGLKLSATAAQQIRSQSE